MSKIGKKYRVIGEYKTNYSDEAIKGDILECVLIDKIDEDGGWFKNLKNRGEKGFYWHWDRLEEVKEEPLKRKLKNIIVHTPTQQDWDYVMNKLVELGKRSEYYNGWDDFKDKTCIWCEKSSFWDYNHASLYPHPYELISVEEFKELVGEKNKEEPYEAIAVYAMGKGIFKQIENNNKPKQKTMCNKITKFAKNLKLSKEEKLYRKVGLQNEESQWTTEAMKLIFDLEAQDRGFKDFEELIMKYGYKDGNRISFGIIEADDFLKKHKEKIKEIAEKYEKKMDKKK